MKEPTRDELAKRMKEAQGFGDVINMLRDGRATVGEPDMFGRYPVLVNGYNTGRAVTRAFLEQVKKVTINVEDFADRPQERSASKLWTPQEIDELM